MSGYVYILTNPSFRDNWVKIGKSARPVDVRSKELDNTAVPLPFEPYAELKTEKYAEAVIQIHRMIDLVNPSVRIRKGREFFNVTPEVALRILEQCALTLDDAEIRIYEHNQNGYEAEVTDSNYSTKPQVRGVDYNSKSSRLTFDMLGIPVGSELTFVENPAIKAITVNGQSTIRLEDGTTATMSRMVALVKRRLGTQTVSEAYQGGNYWMYDGVRLTALRAELESNKDNSIMDNMKDEESGY